MDTAGLRSTPAQTRPTFRPWRRRVSTSDWADGRAGLERRGAQHASFARTRRVATCLARVWCTHLTADLCPERTGTRFQAGSLIIYMELLGPFLIGLWIRGFTLAGLCMHSQVACRQLHNQGTSSLKPSVWFDALGALYIIFTNMSRSFAGSACISARSRSRFGSEAVLHN